MNQTKVIRELLGVRDFRLIWLGVLFSQIGDWMQITTQGWLVVDMTSSALAVTIVTASGIMPQLIFVLVGGVVADQYNKKSIMRILVIAQLVISTLLTVLIINGLTSIFILSLLSFALGICAALWQPIYLSFIPELVPKKLMGTAMGMSLASLYSARTFGPLLASMSIALFGIRNTYIFNTISFLMPLIVLYLIRTDGASVKSKRGVLVDLVEGGRVIAKDKVLLPLWLLSVGLSLGILPVFALLPVFTKDILKTGATGLGVLMGIGGVGQLLGAISISILGQTHSSHYGRKQILGYIVIGCLVCIFSVSQTILISSIAFGFFNFLHGLLSPRVNTIVQLYVMPSLRGRVQSLFLFTFGLVPIGQVALGYMADLLNPQTAIFISSFTFMVTSSLMLMLAPQLSNFELQKI